MGGQCETGLAQHALKVKAGDSTKEIRALEVREFSFGADEIKEERAFQVDGMFCLLNLMQVLRTSAGRASA